MHTYEVTYGTGPHQNLGERHEGDRFSIDQLGNLVIMKEGNAVASYAPGHWRGVSRADSAAE
jgi:hypothetical protein